MPRCLAEAQFLVRVQAALPTGHQIHHPEADRHRLVEGAPVLRGCVERTLTGPFGAASCGLRDPQTRQRAGQRFGGAFGTGAWRQLCGRGGGADALPGGRPLRMPVDTRLGPSFFSSASRPRLGLARDSRYRASHCGVRRWCQRFSLLERRIARHDETGRKLRNVLVVPLVETLAEHEDAWLRHQRGVQVLLE